MLGIGEEKEQTRREPAEEGVLVCMGVVPDQSLAWWS